MAKRIRKKAGIDRNPGAQTRPIKKVTVSPKPVEWTKDSKKRIIEVMIPVVLIPVIIFISAGRIDLWRIWLYFGITFIVNALTFTILPLFFPEVLEIAAQRAKKRTGTKSWDKVFSVFSIITTLFIPIVAGLDIGRYEWSNIHSAFILPGVILLLAGYVLIEWALLVNRHFEKTVRIQKDRGHKVVTKGPYQYVRHPGYVAMIIMNLAFPLITGSALSFIPVLMIIGLFIIRTQLEDRTLQEELTGYKPYTKKVRYRLLPGVW
ncbi:MAG: isoprenylcysteine carboxylmethyltransferase family protein [Spirochaetes bacterium]|nr:isoprenylcysteine carboxylmethyltransferase family protein [Spirochaetota bacterium]